MRSRGILSGSRRAAAGRTRAMILLEVLLAMAILALGVAAIGGQMYQALRASDSADRVARAVLLTESLFTELDSGLILPEQEQEGDFLPFGAQYDGWMWLMTIAPTPDEGVFLVTAGVYYGDPEFTTEDIDDKELIYEAYTLRAEPGTVNLVDELGVDQEELQNLSDLLDVPGLDLAGDLNPSELAGFDFEKLSEVLPLLPPQLLSLLGASGGSLAEMAQAASQMAGNGTLDVGSLRDSLDQALGGGDGTGQPDLTGAGGGDSTGQPDLTGAGGGDSTGQSDLTGAGGGNRDGLPDLTGGGGRRGGGTR